MNKKHRTQSKSPLLIISCGGTITGKRNVDNSIKPFSNISILIKNLARDENIDFINLFNILSEDMNPLHWVAITSSLEKEILRNKYKAIIILHGTFTLPYTASALSFMMQNLPIPLILTGSVFTPYDKGTDVFDNINMSLKAADKLVEFPGVYVVAPMIDANVYPYFAKTNNSISVNNENRTYCIFKGINLRKLHSWQINCFQSINTPAFAEIKNDTFIFNIKNNSKAGCSPVGLKVSTKLDPRVCCIKIFPGFDANLLLKLVKWYKAFIIEGYADGTLPTFQDYNFLDVAKILLKQHIPFFLTSQPSGITTLTAYQGGVKLHKLGVIPLYNMTTETAIVKLMWVLGQSNRFSEVNKLMQKNIAGEIEPVYSL